MRLPRVLLLTHYYYPELGAPQTRLRETVRLLVEGGHDVQVLTGPPHYPDGHVRSGYSAIRLRRESIDGVPVTRLPMWPRPNKGVLDRTIDQASFAAAACAALNLARWSDVVLVESPSLFLGLTAIWFRFVARRPYVFHVADPWPDFPIAMGALRQPVLRRLARWMESSAYRYANLITTVTPGLVDLLGRNPAANGKLRLLPNAVDVSRFGLPINVAAVRASLGWSEGRFAIVYLGSVGLAQGMWTLLDAMELLPGADVEVHVIGEGAERFALEESARQRGIAGVRFHAGIPAAEAPRILAAADAVLVMLREGPIYDHALPTKLVEGLASGKPLIVSAGGDAARIVEESRAGFTARPEDPNALRAAIVACATAADLRSRGLAARQIAEESFDRRIVVEQLAGYLDEAMADGAGS